MGRRGARLRRRAVPPGSASTLARAVPPGRAGVFAPARGRAAASALVRALLAAAAIATALAGCSPEPEAGGGSASKDTSITVSAASDLALAFDELGPLFTKETGVAVVVNLGSSGQLAQQIEEGAPVDVFFSANRGYVDELVEKGIVTAADTAVYGVGRLTMWTRADSPLRLESLDDLTDPAVGRIAVANPDHAPYGMAARQALRAAGLWDELQPKVVLAENVLQALQFADSGNVDVAFVARSLSVQGEGRWVLVDAALHDPILQTLAVIPSSRQAEWGRRFAEFVTGPVGRPILDRYGFALPDGAASGGSSTGGGADGATEVPDGAVSGGPAPGSAGGASGG